MWPENWLAVDIFLGLRTQWRRSGMGGPTGLDYAVLWQHRKFRDLDAAAQEDTEIRIRMLEAAALNLMNKVDG